MFDEEFTKNPDPVIVRVVPPPMDPEFGETDVIVIAAVMSVGRISEAPLARVSERR